MMSRKLSQKNEKKGTDIAPTKGSMERCQGAECLLPPIVHLGEVAEVEAFFRPLWLMAWIRPATHALTAQECLRAGRLHLGPEPIALGFQNSVYRRAIDG